MGFSSTKNVCEIMNLLVYFDSILSNYRRMGVKRQIYIVYKHTDIFKTWTVSGDATSILRASLPISGSTTTPTPRALLQVERQPERPRPCSMCTRPRPLLGVWCHGPCTTSCSGRRSPRSLRPKKSTPGCTMRPMPSSMTVLDAIFLGGDPLFRNEGARNSPIHAAAAGGHARALELLLRGAPEKQLRKLQNANGNTPLHMVVGRVKLDDACVACVELLLDAGLIVLLATSPDSHHWL